jgi:FkbH-like protein
VLRLCGERRRLLSRSDNPLTRRTVRMALLGGATTELIEEPLLLALDAVGLKGDLLRTGYNTFAHEMLAASSTTAAFCPEVAVVVNTPANIPCWPEPGMSLEAVNAIVNDVCEFWLHLCRTLHERTNAEILINTFQPVPLSPLGNLGAKLPWDRNSFIRRLNRALCDRLPGYVHANDVESLSARYGLRLWFDSRYWFHAKQLVSFDCLWPYVRNTAAIIGALFGMTSKCIVVDLDNTLWGGVVGDDGPEGLVIGEGTAVGEAFKAFQEHLLRLKQRGVMLAVCSKNDHANATAAFDRRPEMALKTADFACFKANWQSKPDNLREIAAELNLGLDALVFLDDNPAEREHVRRTLPDVTVLDLSDDPADYPDLLDEARLFEVTSVSPEDRDRTTQYQDNSRRLELERTSADYDGFLRSLRQVAVIRPFDAMHLDRITQLINKTNQFNLVTARRSRSELQALMDDKTSVTAHVRLADRFGDNGLISVVIAQVRASEFWIEDWLMSCRVLKRGVEFLLCNHLVERARMEGATRLRGIYRPTAKNVLVRDHYKTLGFRLTRTDGTGTTHWELDVNGFTPFDVPIERVGEYPR